ncbi:MAG TPA: hypothetical protein PLP34_02325, partial [Chitinophagaceae bacterium]|nr:hypothetical protein [Chitinophagaceae bacterium]
MSLPVVHIPFRFTEAFLELEFTGLIAASFTCVFREASNDSVLMKHTGNNARESRFRFPIPQQLHPQILDIHSTIKGLYDDENQGPFAMNIQLKADGIVVGEWTL